MGCGDWRHQLALIFRTGSVRSLLRHGIDQLLEMRYINADIDPGVSHVVHRRREKQLMKLT